MDDPSPVPSIVIHIAFFLFWLYLWFADHVAEYQHYSPSEKDDFSLIPYRRAFHALLLGWFGYRIAANIIPLSGIVRYVSLFGVLYAVYLISVFLASLFRSVETRTFRAFLYPAYVFFKMERILLEPFLLVHFEETQKRQTIRHSESEDRRDFGFHKITISDITHPRVDLPVFGENLTIKDVLKYADRLRYNWILVEKQKLDETSIDVRCVFLNDMLRVLYRRGDNVPLAELPSHHVGVVVKSRPVHKFFNEEDYRKWKYDFRLVVDEYGGFHGVVFLKDIFEIVLAIDLEKVVQKFIVRIAEGEWEVDAQCPIELFWVEMGFDMNSCPRDVETVGGWFMKLSEKYPKPTDEIHFLNLILTVEDMRDNRILALHVRRKDSDESRDETPMTSFPSQRASTISGVSSQPF